MRRWSEEAKERRGLQVTAIAPGSEQLDKIPDSKWPRPLVNDCKVRNEPKPHRHPQHIANLPRRYPVQPQPDQLPQSSFVHRMSMPRQRAGNLAIHRRREHTHKALGISSATTSCLRIDSGPWPWRLAKPIRRHFQPRMVIREPHGAATRRAFGLSRRAGAPIRAHRPIRAQCPLGPIAEKAADPEIAQARYFLAARNDELDRHL